MSRFDRKGAGPADGAPPSGRRQRLTLGNITWEALAQQANGLVRLHREGRHEELVRQARALLDADPEQGRLWHWLGVGHLGLGENAAGRDALARAAALLPQDAEVWEHLGAAHTRLKAYAAAEQCFARSLALNPQRATAWSNRARNLSLENRPGEALAAYGRAIELDPGLIVAVEGRAKLRHRLGQWQSALDELRALPAEARRSPELDKVEGALLAKLRRWKEAEEVARRALAALPDDEQAAMVLAELYAESRRGEQAVALLEDVLQRRPGSVLWNYLGCLSITLGDTQRALRAYRASLALADTPEARLGSAIALVPAALREEDAATVRERFVAALDSLPSAQAIRAAPGAWVQSILAVGFPFALAYLPGDNSAALRRLGEFVAQVAAAAAPPPAAAPARPRGGRIRLGIVTAHIHQHSVWNVLVKGVFQHLDRERFELLVYYTGTDQDADTAWARTRADGWRERIDHYRDWVAAIRGDAPDILYFPEIGMRPLALLLGATRLAPLQVASWGHPITSGLPHIDVFLSGELLEGPEADAHYRERLVRLPGVGVCSIAPEVAPRPPPPDWTDWPAARTTTRFVVCQMIAKLAPEDDPLYVRIARQVGDCRFWFFREGKYRLAFAAWEARLRAAFADAGLDPGRYLRFVDRLPRAAFLGALGEMDVFLDPPAFSGYTTAWQAARMGLPIVTREGPFLRQRLAAGLLRQIGVSETIAADEQAYVDIAARLARDPAARRQVAQRLRERCHLADERVEAVRALEREFMALLRRAPGAAAAPAGADLSPGRALGPLVVEVTRGGVVESRHRVTAVVVDARGGVVAAWGDAQLRTFPRSTLKPVQALALVEGGAAAAFGLGSEELALAAASHSGEPRHAERVAAWLARIGLEPQALECGGPSPLHHNCSGKHTGFLTLARHLGVAHAGYIDADHPVQRLVGAVIADMTGEAAAPWGIDGCGIPAFALPLTAVAQAMARMADPAELPPARAAAARAIVAAMAAHPELVGGEGRLCTHFMRRVPRIVVKDGAEGFYGAIVPERGWGVAVKAEDGAGRAAEVAVLTVLARLGLLLADEQQSLAQWLRPPVLNGAGRVVGEVRVAE